MSLRRLPQYRGRDSSGSIFMIPFEYQRPATAEEAVRTVAARPDAAFLGGGTNLVDHMKLGVAEPDLLVDVSCLPFTEITETAEGGLRRSAPVGYGRRLGGAGRSCRHRGHRRRETDSGDRPDATLCWRTDSSSLG